MSDKQKDKKKKKATIVAGIVGSAALIGGITAGIITTTETEENKKNKQTSTANPSAGQSKSQKNDLNNKVKTLWSDILFNANKTNQELDSIILSDIHLTNWLQPNLVNPTIKYFSDSQAQTEVTNKTQKSGYLYVVITTNDNDPNYQGSTNPMKISLKQYKLSDIQQLTGLNLITDSSKKFWEIEDEINYKANEFKNKIKINGLYSVTKFYDSPTSNNDLSLENQRKGNFWIVIRTSSLEPNWYGETPKIKITLK